MSLCGECVSDHQGQEHVFLSEVHSLKELLPKLTKVVKLFWMKMVNLSLNHLAVSFKFLELVFTMTQLFQLKNVSCQLTFWIQKLVSINHSTQTELTTL